MKAIHLTAYGNPAQNLMDDRLARLPGDKSVDDRVKASPWIQPVYGKAVLTVAIPQKSDQEVAS